MKRIIYSMFLMVALCSVCGCDKGLDAAKPQKCNIEVIGYFDSSDDKSTSRVTGEEIKDGDGKVTAIHPKWAVGDVVYGCVTRDGSQSNISLTVTGTGTSTGGKSTAKFEEGYGCDGLQDGDVVSVAYTPGAPEGLNFDLPRTVSIASQNGTLDGALQNAVMIATGTVEKGSLKLKFENKMSIVRIYNVGNVDASSKLIVSSCKGVASSLILNPDSEGNLTITAGDEYSEITADYQTKDGTYVAMFPTDVYGIEVWKTYENDTYAAYSTKKNTFAVGESYGLDFKSKTFEKRTLGSLRGKFSISATQQVRFARGNLWCDETKTPKEYGFESNQYSNVFGDATPDATSHRTHFLKANYQDNKTSNMLFANPNSEINPCKGWETLTNDEWSYLLGLSTSKRSCTNKYVNAVVAGNPGLLIFPDDYSWPDGVTMPTDVIINKPVNFKSKAPQYTLEEFLKLEQSGFVFLAVQGRLYRNASYKYEYDSFYDSKTGYGIGRYVTSDMGNTNVKFLNFSHQDTNFNPGTAGNYGYSIRLACPVNK